VDVQHCIQCIQTGMLHFAPRRYIKIINNYITNSRVPKLLITIQSSSVPPAYSAFHSWSNASTKPAWLELPWLSHLCIPLVLPALELNVQVLRLHPATSLLLEGRGEWGKSPPRPLLLLEDGAHPLLPLYRVGHLLFHAKYDHSEVSKESRLSPATVYPSIQQM
jgi:hypothetical protein